MNKYKQVPSDSPSTPIVSKVNVAMQQRRIYRAMIYLSILVVVAAEISNLIIASVTFVETRDSIQYARESLKELTRVRETNFYNAHLSNYIAFLEMNANLFGSDDEADTFLARGYAASGVLNAMSKYGYSSTLMDYTGLSGQNVYVCVLKHSLDVYVSPSTHSFDMDTFLADGISAVYHKTPSGQTMTTGTTASLSAYTATIRNAVQQPVSVTIFQNNVWQVPDTNQTISLPPFFATGQVMGSVLLIVSQGMLGL